jgi:hypothetical protein
MEHKSTSVRYALPQTLDNASQIAATFCRLVRDIPYEDRGVLFSEMLFLFATIGNPPPRRILESGRARGLSTLVLARCFPDARIISIESDCDSDDAASAEKKLRNVPNVDLLYGDSTRLFPKLVQPKDVLMIDGPKSFRALFLALALLEKGAAVAFLHDFYQGLPERELIERNLPEAFFSDDPEFVADYAYLDEKCWEAKEKRQLGGRKPYDLGGVQQSSYGPTFACIPANSNRSYRPMIDQGTREALINRTKDLLVQWRYDSAS